MAGRNRTAVRWVAILVAAGVAFVALRTPDPLTDIVGAVVLVLLAGWLLVKLYRGRKRLVR